MAANNVKFDYLLRLGDNALILGQRLGEWCGHGPILEQDIAITNIALDQIGQARAWLAYAGEVEGLGHDEDHLAFLREAHQFCNVLLVEQPNTDWAYTIMRQFIFDAANYYIHQGLTHSNDPQLSAIAVKSLKEVTYHLRYSSEWVIRLGDGTELSRQKMQTALDDLWMYAGELTEPDEIDRAAAAAGFGVDLDAIRPLVQQKLANILTEATLTPPANTWMQSGGKRGIHSEHLGFILTDMQWLQRTHPGATW